MLPRVTDFFGWFRGTLDTESDPRLGYGWCE